MGKFETAFTVAGYRGSPQDRVEVFNRHPEIVIAVADGAGGSGGGAAAAGAVVGMIGMSAGVVSGYKAWADRLKEIDDSVHDDPSGGQSTGIVVEVSPKGIVGASVGDSQAWIISTFAKMQMTNLVTLTHKEPLSEHTRNLNSPVLGHEYWIIQGQNVPFVGFLYNLALSQ